MRTDTASAIIQASPQKIYNVLLNPYEIPKWRPPQGMTCTIYHFAPHEGGAFRMAFTHATTDPTASGKTTAHSDVFHGHFATLIPNQTIVEVIHFESDDPAFEEAMTITTTLEPLPHPPQCTKLTITCSNVPDAISETDHQLGMTSSLKNLAAFVE